MSSTSEAVKETKEFTKSIGRIIIDHLNIFENVRKLYNNILHGDGRSVFRSTVKVTFNVILLYSLRKMMFPIILAMAVFTIPKFFLKPKQKKSYLIQANGNEVILIENKHNF
uniref:Pex24p domain-containing protein n=1 Tax=Strongyloides stercoralis TaxID=6248 RepID=A0A0K0E358_STRER